MATAEDVSTVPRQVATQQQSIQKIMAHVTEIREHLDEAGRRLQITEAEQARTREQQ